MVHVDGPYNFFFPFHQLPRPASCSSSGGAGQDSSGDDGRQAYFPVMSRSLLPRQGRTAFFSSGWQASSPVPNSLLLWWLAGFFSGAQQPSSPV
jgi:hypothetical protein